MFNNVLGLGYGLADWPMTQAETQAVSRKVPTKADQIWAAIRDFLGSRGIAHRQIINSSFSLGLMSNSPKTMGTLAAYMSERKQLLVKHGEGRWSLAEELFTSSNETPNSGTLFGAPKGNGSSPLSP